ncbi:MAG: M56 family metallopeptidase [Nocardioidaceae bacterium]
MTTLLLSVLAVLFAWPAPVLLARLTPLRRVPRAAVVLWQAVALAAVLSALGAGLSLVTGSALNRGAGPVSHVAAAVALLLTGTVLARLLLAGHRVGTRVRGLRRRHRALVDLLSADDAGVRVLDHPTPMAYCLPGHHSRVVVSAGARAVLAPAELAAVLAHERAHLRARHDLVLEAFTVLHEAFPRVVTGEAALREVRLLVEVLADRSARRRTGARPLVRALVALADGRAPDAALGAAGAGAGLVQRVELVRDATDHRALASAVYAAAAAVVGLPTVFVALPWLASLR